MKMKYILEDKIKARRGDETIVSVQKYLNTNPHPDYRLVTFTFNYGGIGGILLVWELKDNI